MIYEEFGKQNGKVIILLHGGGLSWWNYREAAELLQNDFRIIIPILDGHAKSDHDFTTIEENAARIIDFIDENFAGKILMIGGLSLGAQILLEILSLRKNICQYAIVESALVIPSKLTHSFIKPAISSCYSLIRHRWFSKLQFQALHIQKTLFDEYYRDSCGITKDNLIAFLRANSLYQLKENLSNCNAIVSIYVGSKENHAMHKSAKQIHEKLNRSSLTVLPQLHHGEFSINHANAYVKAIYALINQKQILSDLHLID
ncbi:MAG: alpha/beta hydrolase [Erysipelotrichaceae bacterium]|nr:alpha/beta hydrolase [Erysipelotrichaceae bacterium]